MVKRPFLVIQARMSSSRLPGKVLYPIAGRPLLDFQLSRLRKVEGVRGIVVATSDDPTDDPIAEYCRQKKIACSRGDLQNVARRFYETIRRFKMEAFVRISGDSPLIDPQLISQGVRIFKDSDFEIVTNCIKRTFPKGQCVEVLSSTAFERGFHDMSDPSHEEHVTPYFYQHADKFRIYNFESGTGDYSSINMCIDTREDLMRLETLVNDAKKDISSYPLNKLLPLFQESCPV